MSITICKNCRHYRKVRFTPAECRLTALHKTDFVTGVKSTTYVDCSDINTDGQCRYFKPLEEDSSNESA